MNANHQIGSSQQLLSHRSTARRDRFAQMTADQKPVGAQFAKLLTFLAVFFLTATFAFAQSPNVRVRLYSLHSEQRIKVMARTAELKWKTCEQCEAKHAPQLDLMFSAAGVKINGGRSEKQVFVEGDYRIEPSEGLSLSVNFPLE